MRALPSFHRRFIAVFLAIGWTLASFGVALTPAPALARDNTVYYRAELATPAVKSTAIADGLLWHCKGEKCAATKDRSKPWVACKRLVKEVGTITSFTFGGDALPADQLEQCNAR